MPDTDRTDSAAVPALLDLAAFPIDRLDAPEGQALIARCRADLTSTGMFNLAGFVRPAALSTAVAELTPLLADGAFRHARKHDIWFGAPQPDLPADHPARREIETSNRTVTGDRTLGTVIRRIYDWPPLAAFLAATMGKPVLHSMADPLACLNVMGYGESEGLNWHFDRSQFTVTLLLQNPEAGGEFEYRRNLRGEGEPNYDGVARLLAGQDPDMRSVRLEAGTLNVFAGRNTAHRAAPTRGSRDRIIAVMSFV